MKICLESQLLNHHKRSGVLTYTEGLINGLKQNDQENEYELAFYSLTRQPKEMPGPGDQNFHKSVLRVPDQPFIGRQFFIDQFFLPSFLKSQKIDVFHRPSGYTMPTVKGVFKILTIHDLRTLTIGDNVWKQNIADYQKTVNSLDICVTVSECTKIDILKHFQIDEKKIKVVYLGADERFKPSTQEAIQKTKDKYQLNEPFLLSLGSVPRKNLDGIIRGFALSKSNKDHILILSCNLETKKYADLAENLGMKDRIRILDKLTDDEIVTLYSSCRAFVFPSLYEGFGLPILEAFQCKAPVITSNLSSCPEVAGEAAILVDPNKDGEIAAAIDQVCSDNNLRKQLIEKGEQRAKIFGWNKFALEMKKIYALA